jgi:DNA-binding MarR family transcriptional regulator
MTRPRSRIGELHLDDLLPYLMNRLIARMNQNLADALRERGFTFQDWRVLAVLAAHEGANLTELAEASVIPQPSVSRLIANLGRRGYVERRSLQNDSRVVRVFLTAKGRSIYRKMLPLALSEYRAATKGFSAADSEALRCALQRMMENRNVRLLPDTDSASPARAAPAASTATGRPASGRAPAAASRSRRR